MKNATALWVVPASTPYHRIASAEDTSRLPATQAEMSHRNPICRASTYRNAAVPKLYSKATAWNGDADVPKRSINMVW